MVLPLSVMSLVQNIKFQLASVASLSFVMVVWIYIFATHGLDLAIPAFGNNQSALIGFVLSNFAFVGPAGEFLRIALTSTRLPPCHHSLTSYPAMYLSTGQSLTRS
jgi:hypothetical protein